MTTIGLTPTLQQLDDLVPVHEGYPKLVFIEKDMGGGRHVVYSDELPGLRVMVSIDRAQGRDFYHVSCSRSDRTMPSWAQLKFVRWRLFKPSAVVFQVFPPEDEWFTRSEVEVLHLWQRIGADRLIPDLRGSL